MGQAAQEERDQLFDVFDMMTQRRHPDCQGKEVQQQLQVRTRRLSGDGQEAILVG